MLPVLFCVVIKLSFLIYWGRILTSKHALLDDFIRRVDDLLLKHLAVIEAVDLLLQAIFKLFEDIQIIAHSKQVYKLNA